MDTYKAYLNNMAAQERGDDGYVFDWDKAARIIRETKPEEAGAGLQGDWEWTGGTIWRSGKIVPRSETYTFLASSWCRAELSLDGELQECWIHQSKKPEWDSTTYWPESAIAILNGE